MTTTPQLPGDGAPTSRSSRKTSIIALALAGLMSATALTTLPLLPESQPAAAQTTFNRAPAEGFADLVERVMPAVISVEVRYGVASSRTERVQGQFQLPELDPDNPFRQFFERFGGDPRRFGMPEGPFPRSAGQGSGFIISEDGYAVTNNHVVANAEEVTVTLS